MVPRIAEEREEGGLLKEALVVNTKGRPERDREQADAEGERQPGSCRVGRDRERDGNDCPPYIPVRHLPAQQLLTEEVCLVAR